MRYLPPSAPDMNPIESVLQAEAFLRKIAERTVAIDEALETCAEIFKPTECEHYFARAAMIQLIDSALDWAERLPRPFAVPGESASIFGSSRLIHQPSRKVAGEAPNCTPAGQRGENKQ